MKLIPRYFTFARFNPRNGRNRAYSHIALAVVWSPSRCIKIIFELIAVLIYIFFYNIIRSYTRGFIQVGVYDSALVRRATISHSYSL